MEIYIFSNLRVDGLREINEIENSDYIGIVLVRGRAKKEPRNRNFSRFRIISLSLIICAVICSNGKFWGRDLKYF